jgi:hypothetical protein
MAVGEGKLRKVAEERTRKYSYACPGKGLSFCREKALCNTGQTAWLRSHDTKFLQWRFPTSLQGADEWLPRLILDESTLPLHVVGMELNLNRLLDGLSMCLDLLEILVCAAGCNIPS